MRGHGLHASSTRRAGVVIASSDGAVGGGSERHSRQALGRGHCVEQRDLCTRASWNGVYRMSVGFEAFRPHQFARAGTFVRAA